VPLAIAVRCWSEFLAKLAAGRHLLKQTPPELKIEIILIHKCPELLWHTLPQCLLDHLKVLNCIRTGIVAVLLK
jgi:hypothetical protein